MVLVEIIVCLVSACIYAERIHESWRFWTIFIVTRGVVGGRMDSRKGGLPLWHHCIQYQTGWTWEQQSYCYTGKRPAKWCSSSIVIHLHAVHPHRCELVLIRVWLMLNNVLPEVTQDWLVDQIRFSTGLDVMYNSNRRLDAEKNSEGLRELKLKQQTTVLGTIGWEYCNGWDKDWEICLLGWQILLMGPLKTLPYLASGLLGQIVVWCLICSWLHDSNIHRKFKGVSRQSQTKLHIKTDFRASSTSGLTGNYCGMNYNGIFDYWIQYYSPFLNASSTGQPSGHELCNNYSIYIKIIVSNDFFRNISIS